MLNLLRRFGIGVAASDPPEIPPTPDPTPEEKAAQFSEQLHAIDAELKTLDDRFKEFKRVHMTVRPSRGLSGRVRWVHAIAMEETSQRAALEQVWQSLNREAVELYKRRNAIQTEAAPYWTAKKTEEPHARA
jgi:prefoldin subunit 5